jgi:hypothetical protein
MGTPYKINSWTLVLASSGEGTWQSNVPPPRHSARSEKARQDEVVNQDAVCSPSIKQSLHYSTQRRPHEDGLVDLLFHTLNQAARPMQKGVYLCHRSPPKPIFTHYKAWNCPHKGPQRPQALKMLVPPHEDGGKTSKRSVRWKNLSYNLWGWSCVALPQECSAQSASLSKTPHAIVETSSPPKRKVFHVTDEWFDIRIDVLVKQLRYRQWGI